MAFHSETPICYSLTLTLERFAVNSGPADSHRNYNTIVIFVYWVECCANCCEGQGGARITGHGAADQVMDREYSPHSKSQPAHCPPPPPALLGSQSLTNFG